MIAGQPLASYIFDARLKRRERLLALISEAYRDVLTSELTLFWNWVRSSLRIRSNSPDRLNLDRVLLPAWNGR